MRCWDDVCFLYNLANGTTLAQEIVVSPGFPITEIHAIEDNKFHGTFLYVAFGSQSRLWIVSDLTRSDTITPQNSEFLNVTKIH
jgi:hypothetical protein